MPATFNVRDAKAKFSRLIERVQAGEEIVLAKAGRPYARLMPLEQPAPRRQPGRLSGRLASSFFDPLPNEELDAWDDR